MAFLDMFLSEDKKIAKNRRRLTSRDSQAEDREVAARWLATNGSPKALVALLSRFDMKLEHQLNDKTEKDLVYGLCAELGDAIVKPLKSWLKQCRSVSIPLRLLEEVTDEETALQQVYALLEAERIRDDFKPEKKQALLTWLIDRRHPGALAVAEPFLDDFDENVRCAAAEVMINQQDPAAAAPLERRVVLPEEDSTRLKHRVAEVFSQRGWTVTSPGALEGTLPDGYALRGDRVVRRG